MDAVKFLSEASRMCGSTKSCAECAANEVCGFTPEFPSDFGKVDQMQKMVKLVEKWAEEHPRKTRQSVFLEQWPNANVIGGYLRICPRDLTGDTSNCGKILCSNCTRNYWLQEVE